MTSIELAPARLPAFACTACGRCCHGLRLPLSVAEARDWAANGGTVELRCEAAPDLGPPGDAAALHRWAIGFPAHSGGLAIRVALTPVAAFDGACPRLLPDRRCGAYERRPNACRIYPAEVRPDRAVDPADKLCPPEAWNAAPGPANDAATAAGTAIRALTIAQRDDRATKARLAHRLGLTDVALANEGSVVVVLAADRLLAAIAAVAEEDDEVPATDWRFVTASATTAALVADAGGTVARAGARAGARYEPFVAAHDIDTAAPPAVRSRGWQGVT